jgi:hypothetical protein
VARRILIIAVGKIRGSPYEFHKFESRSGRLITHPNTLERALPFVRLLLPPATPPPAPNPSVPCGAHQQPVPTLPRSPAFVCRNVSQSGCRDDAGAGEILSARSPGTFHAIGPCRHYRLARISAAASALILMRAPTRLLTHGLRIVRQGTESNAGRKSETPSGPP